MADTTPSQDPRAAFEHRCNLIGIDGAALKRWEEGCENPAMAGQYVRNHVEQMWQAYQWRAEDAAPQPNAALADEEQKDLFAVALFLSCRHDPTCILKDEDAERAIGLLLRLSGFELPAPPTLNASKEAGNG